MNSVNLIGRLVKNVEIKQLSSGKRMSKFSLAVRRSDDKADFISCTAFDKMADVLVQYCNKGDQIGINGAIRAGMEDDKYHSNVVVSSIFLIGSKKNDNNINDYNTPKSSNYTNYNEETDDFPF